MEFSEWITKKYVEWRGEAVGRSRSVSEFADFIGVKQQAMSSWMYGIVPKDYENIIKLAAKLGDEVYDVLNVPHPPQSDPIYDIFYKYFYRMTAEERERYLTDISFDIEESSE